MKKLKILLWGGLALTVLLAGNSAARAAQAAKQFTYEIKPKLSGLDVEGLKIDVDSTFSNPTNGQIKVRDTVITVYHEDRELTKLDLRGRTITIAPKSTGMLSDSTQLGSPIRVSIPYKAIEKLAPLVIAAKLGLGPPMKFMIHIRAKVKIPFVPAIPVSVKTPFILENSI